MRVLILVLLVLVLLVLVLVTGGKQSQLLVLSLSLKFDNSLKPKSEVVKTSTTTSIQLNATLSAVGFDVIMTVNTTPPPRNSTPDLGGSQCCVN